MGEHVYDVVVVGGGQAGLASGYFLRRRGLDFVILDDGEGPGGSWVSFWDSLRLFSTAAHSPLPGWWMPEEPGQEYPSARHVVKYFAAYEQRYELPVRRPVRVGRVEPAGDLLRVVSDRGSWLAGHVISATGTWRAPRIPDVPGRGVFEGRQLHTVDYRNPAQLAGLRLVVVGGGNSAAQILAELSPVAETVWATPRPPRFLPEELDGSALFELATRRTRTREAGGAAPASLADLGDIVAVPSVREARERGALKAEPMFDRLTRHGVAWADGTEFGCDAVLWCTGFRPVLDHLEPLGVRSADGRIVMDGHRAAAEPRLHPLGYGEWTGPASATIIGVGRAAKATVAAIAEALGQPSRRART